MDQEQLKNAKRIQISGYGSWYVTIQFIPVNPWVHISSQSKLSSSTASWKEQQKLIITFFVMEIVIKRKLFLALNFREK